MKPFLRQVAQAILAKHGTALRGVAVVLPSQRAGLYLRKWLAQEAGRALWSPQLLTIGTFMEEVAGVRALPMEELLFEGYAAYQAVEGEKARPFSEFLQWAPTTLADISEADAHLVPLESYYRDLRNWEAIEWTFNNDPLSEGQQRMVRFWAMVGRMHAALNTRLQERQAGTGGLVERLAVERAGQALDRWEGVWFTGLNAFTPAQEAVLRRFVSHGKSFLAWDADRYYLERPEQEAGLHLRKAIAAFGPGVIPPADGLASAGEQMRAVRTPNEAAQAWCAAELLKHASPEQREQTAVVLADSNLLQPLLEALPPDIGPVNVTMGLPISQLPIGAFLDALHRLHAGLRPGSGFFYTDVERFLAHPMLRHPATEKPMAAVLEAIRGRQRVYVDPGFIQEACAKAGVFPEAAAVFAEVSDVRAQLPGITAHALAWAKRAMAGNRFATEQVFQAAQVLQRLHLLLGRHPVAMDLKAYAAVFARLLRSAQIGLFGEPLAGVQVMGMLEARALDPAHLIVLGAQEGSLPTADSGRSYIPFELRRAHAMPLPEGNDAVQAYNFLRMLQRAQEAVLVWPEGAEPTGPSRFILQLRHELPNGRDKTLVAADLQLPIPPKRAAAVAIGKDAALLQALRGRLEQGLSPSAIGDWLACPLDFHFKHVLRLRESPDVGARIADNVLGEALHAVVEQIYRPWIGEPVKAEDLARQLDGLGGMLATELGQRLGGGSLAQGQPLLQAHLAEHAARRFLQQELAKVRKGDLITPMALELALRQPLGPAAAAIGSPVFLKGRLDRVDRVNGVLRILDLKSGKVEDAGLALGGLEPEFLTSGKRYAVQLLVYAWMFLCQHPAEEEVQAGILPLRRAASSEPVLLKVAGQARIAREQLPAIEALLTGIVQRMLDPDLPVMHDPRSTYCTFCLPGQEP